MNLRPSYSLTGAGVPYYRCRCTVEFVARSRYRSGALANKRAYIISAFFRGFISFWQTMLYKTREFEHTQQAAARNMWLKWQQMRRLFLVTPVTPILQTKSNTPEYSLDCGPSQGWVSAVLAKNKINCWWWLHKRNIQRETERKRKNGLGIDPEKMLPSPAIITVWEGLRDGRIYRPFPPKEARSRYDYTWYTLWFYRVGLRQNKMNCSTVVYSIAHRFWAHIGSTLWATSNSTTSQLA